MANVNVEGTRVIASRRNFFGWVSGLLATGLVGIQGKAYASSLFRASSLTRVHAAMSGVILKFGSGSSPITVEMDAAGDSTDVKSKFKFTVTDDNGGVAKFTLSNLDTEDLINILGAAYNDNSAEVAAMIKARSARHESH